MTMTSAPGAPAVRLHDVHCTLGARAVLSAGTRALAGLSFEAPAGQVTALVGSNGSGKTTALRAALGAVVPQAGQVEIEGVSMAPAEQAVPPGVALVPDASAWPDDWTAHDIARALRSARIGADLAELGRRLRAREVPLNRPLSRLSAGQVTQVDLVAALCRHPRLLLLDEPLARLDPLARHAMVDELRDVMARPGRSIVLSTHDLEGMDRFVDHLVVMHAGRAVAEGAVEDLRENHLLAILPAAHVGRSRAEQVLLGAESRAGNLTALVRVDDAPLLGPGVELMPPDLSDVVTHLLRHARTAGRHAERAA